MVQEINLTLTGYRADEVLPEVSGPQEGANT